MQNKGISFAIVSSMILFGTPFSAQAQMEQSGDLQRLAMVRIEPVQPHQRQIKIESKETAVQQPQIDKTQQVKQLIAEQEKIQEKAPALLLDSRTLAQVVQNNNINEKLASVSHIPSAPQAGSSQTSLIETCALESGSEAPCLTWQWR